MILNNDTEQKLAKVDLHLHSYASNVTDYYSANLFNVPESYSDPIETYWKLKNKGMDLVTLTDHNSIDGVKEMLDKGFKDVFISCEFTVTFPEDECNAHITVINMTEEQFKELNKLRKNVYEFISFVNSEIREEAWNSYKNKIEYFVTHPLMSTQNRPYGRVGALSIHHVQKLILLCRCIEVQNGTRCQDLNNTTLEMVNSLNEDAIDRLANKYSITPIGVKPWLKAIVGGSDDHSGINPGETYTTFPISHDSQITIDDLIDAIRQRRTRPEGAHGSPVNIAHAIMKVMYHHRAQNEEEIEGVKAKRADDTMDLLLRLAFDDESVNVARKVKLKLKASFNEWVKKTNNQYFKKNQPFEKVLNTLALELIFSKEFKVSITQLKTTDEKIFMIVNQLVNRLFVHYMNKITTIKTLDLVNIIKDLIALVCSNAFVSMPYFLAYSNQSADKPILQDVRKAYNLEQKHKVLLVTDTFFEINGVSKTIKKVIRESIARDIDFTVVTCLDETEFDTHLRDPEVRSWVDDGRLKIFPALCTTAFPEYDDLKVRFVPLLEFLKYIQDERFTNMQISTPGTIGCAGLIAAKLMQIPTSATYHTCFPEYVEEYTKDVALEAIAWKYMILFYHMVDEVVVPSKFVAKLLRQRGLRKRNLLILDRWVDHKRFHPLKAVKGFWEQFGLMNEDRYVKFVYIGRVGVEKDLYTLAEAYKLMVTSHPEARLIIVGNGPYQEKLKELLQDVPAIFTGFLVGDQLETAYASADVKVFPSTTDTWGNSVLEAQSSGLPVIVSDKGGPQELMEPNLTGFRFKAKNVKALSMAMSYLMEEKLRHTMSVEARKFILENDIQEPFNAILDSEAFRERRRQMAELDREFQREFDDDHLDSQKVVG